MGPLDLSTREAGWPVRNTMMDVKLLAGSLRRRWYGDNVDFLVGESTVQVNGDSITGERDFLSRDSIARTIVLFR